MTTTLTDTLNEARGEMSDKQDAGLLPCPFESGAFENLKQYQGQLDEDGICVAVSRQALEEVLAWTEEAWNTRNTASGGMGDASTRKDEGCVDNGCLTPPPRSLNSPATTQKENDE